MTKTLGRLMSSGNSPKKTSTLSGATILGVPINTLGEIEYKLKIIFMI